jgi:hypothetical protein
MCGTNIYGTATTSQQRYRQVKSNSLDFEPHSTQISHSAQIQTALFMFNMANAMLPACLLYVAHLYNPTHCFDRLLLHYLSAVMLIRPVL